MSMIRVTIDLAIPQPMPRAVLDKLKIAKTAIHDLKAYAVKVGQEDTVKARWHICHHDTGGECEPEQEI